ncbi:MmcQ/YjbR family DNA-binding protein [Rhizobium sp. G187]|uniref:MmcQ/YjbR family DNA-binding protein n=1 Tax=Rhizobium sp. G187 TaxID=3451352 RepID=UPI003EE7FDE5
MSIFTREGFSAFASKYPGTSLSDQWDSCIAKVGDKVFALLTDQERHLAFKVSEETFEILTSLDGVTQAPYFAKRKWVAVEPGTALSEAELSEYLDRSYRAVSAGLTRKLRTELGIA